MRQVTPSVRELARRILAQEVAENARAEAGMPTAWRAFEKLRLSLVKLVGVAGFQTLLARALGLAKAEVPWLAAVRVQADGTLEEFGATAQQHDTDVVEGCVALMAQMLGLLITFIGEDLTQHLAREVWPDANLGAKETPE